MSQEVLLQPEEAVVGTKVTVWHVVENGRRDHGQGGTLAAITDTEIVLCTEYYGEQRYGREDHQIIMDVPWQPDACIEWEAGVCEGTVDHYSPSGFGGPLRCEFHRNERYQRYLNSSERWANSDVPPSWFDPTAAGERWEDD